MIAPTPDLLEIGSDVSDEALMEEVQLGQHAAIDQLYRRHREKLTAIIFRTLRDDGETEDVLQETLLQIWKEAKSYSARLGRPLGWIVTIARRRAIDRVRRREAYSRAKERFQTFVAREPRAWMQDRVDPEVCASDMRQFLRREMTRLPDFQREAVELTFFDGLSQREIAAATRTPLGTIKTRLELGMRKLTQTIRPNRCKI